MLRNEYLEEIKQKEKNQILLTWYDELNREFVAYIKRDGGRGRMLNQQIDWKRFECNISLKELNSFRDEISLEQMSDKQFNTIKELINSDL